MKALIRFLGVSIVVAILALPASAVIFAQGDEDWAVYMSVTTDPNVGSVPGGGSHFGFGARDGSSDGYDSGEGDEIAPPDPLAGINAYFYYPANPPFQKNLILSVTGPAASIIWPLVVKMVGETGDAEMTISWPDISSVPAKYIVLELQDTGGTTLADMRSVDHYTFSASQGQIYNFQIKAEVEEIQEYDLTIDSTAGGEVTTPREGTFTYDCGDVVDLVATPDAGYRFGEWAGDVDTIADVNAATTNITMNGNYSITANFIAEYDLTIDSTAGGEVTTPGEGTFTYDTGTVVDLVATPEAGYCFVEWTGDVGTIADVDAATTTITMDGNYTVTANFIAGRVHNIDLDEWYLTIQAAIDVAHTGNTIEVAAGEYDAFEAIEKTDISIISTEGATVTTALEPEVGYWVMALVQDSADITIDGIHFDGSGVSEDTVGGIIYGNSTGTITNLTVSGVVGNVTGWGISIWGEITGATSVDISEVTVEDSYIGVMIWNAVANLDLTTITGRGDPHGGIGIMTINGAVVNIENCEISNFWVETPQPGTAGFGMMIGVPVDYEEQGGITLGEELESVVEMIGSTIANNNIGIYVDEYGNLTANFNNIVGNDPFGVLSEVAVNATKNWWGNATGPHHETLNPEGTGDAVSDNVNFEPWLGAAVVTSKGETVTNDGIVDAKGEADTEVLVSGNATVTVALYDDNPGGPAPTGFSSLGKYIDVYIPDTDQVTEIEIRFYYTDAEVAAANLSEESLRLFCWNGTEWAECSDSGVNTASTNGYSGYIWAKIRTDTTPNLEQLTGTPFDGYGTPPLPPPPRPRPPSPPSPTPPAIPPVEYDLTIDNTVGGSVTEPGEGEFTYDAGTVVDLVAEPDEGYQFVNWTGDVDNIDAVNATETTITMDDDYEITANFEEVSPPPILYALAINSTDGGSVTTPGEETFTYDAGTVVDLVAEVEEGYQFVNWTGDVNAIADVDAAATTITMSGNYSITANFKARVNRALIGGIIAAVVVAGLVIFFVRRRRAA